MDEKIEAILDYFGQLNAIPRCSKNEAQVGRWLESLLFGENQTNWTDEVD